tara:strand:+ start:1639 stop:2673 length:1035 start_codon:yes stop_codon:yes gene_type:complete
MIILPYILIFIFSISILFFLIIFKNKFSFIIDDVRDDERKIHSKQIIKVGGLTFLSLSLILLFIENFILIQIIISSFIFLLIGFYADINQNFSSYLRLILSTVIILIFMSVNNLVILNVDLTQINNILITYSAISIFFTLICLLIIINGLNFIDGNHGLMLGASIIMLMNILLSLNDKSNEIELMLIATIIVLSILFLFNVISSNIIAGDTGAYFMGFMIGSVCIYINDLKLINPFHIACILFYPVMEVVVSSIRRVFFYKKNPFYPDSMHMHSIIFKKLKGRYIKKNEANVDQLNFLTSVIILTYLVVVSVFIFMSSNYHVTFYLVCVSYISIYLTLYYFHKK